MEFVYPGHGGRLAQPEFGDKANVIPALRPMYRSEKTSTARKTSHDPHRTTRLVSAEAPHQYISPTKPQQCLYECRIMKLPGPGPPHPLHTDTHPHIDLDLRLDTHPALYRLDLATRSSSSFFLMAYELEEPFAALVSSSARHSATDLVLWKADSRV